MNMLEISDSPFVATSLGTQAALLAAHVPNVSFMGRQVTTGHQFPYANTTHYPFGVQMLKSVLKTRHFGAVHTFMPLNDADIGGAVDNHCVWFCHPLVANDELPPSWIPALTAPDVLLGLSRFETAMLQYKHVKYMPPFLHPEYAKDPGTTKPVPPWKREGEFLIMTVGRPSTRKNIPGLLLALYQLAVVERLPVRLYLHASADDVQATGQGFDLKGMIEALGLRDHVTMPAFDQAAGIPVPELRDLYRAADAYVSTDLGEALGITRIEAMACGTPLVVPDHTSGPELCKDGGITVRTVRANAYFEGVPCKAPVISEVVDAVKWLMDHPTDRKMMGDAARRFVLAEYDNKTTAACWASLLEEYTIAEANFA